MAEFDILSMLLGAKAAKLASYPTDTASGDPANFPDGANGAPVVDLKVKIDLTQPGSGLPSSDNIRPITLWTGATVSHSGADTSDPEELSVSWQTEAGSICAGTLDLTTGVLTVTYIDISDLAEKMTYASSGTDYVQFRLMTDLPASPVPAVRSDRLSSEYPSGTMNRLSAINISGKTYIFGNVPKAVLSSYDQDGLDEWVAQAKPQFVAQLTKPDTWQLLPKPLRTLLGENNIWADTGDVTVEYRADLDLYIEKKCPSTPGSLGLGLSAPAPSDSENMGVLPDADEHLGGLEDEPEEEPTEEEPEEGSEDDDAGEETY